MNAESGMDQSLEVTHSSNNTSRRTFLKGVGLASAAGLVAPLLSSTSARAGGGPLVLGIQAPGPWPGGYAPAGKTWLDLVGTPGHRALACRSYQDDVITRWQDVPTRFPGETSSAGPVKVVASIRPDPALVLGDHPDFENAVKNYIENGMARARNGEISSPQLTAWHEAGNLYKNVEKWGQHIVDQLTDPLTVRQMHVKLKKWCDDVATDNLRVEYGCIIYGEISKMEPYVPFDPFSLDWYGIDVYYEDDAGWGRGDLVDYTAVSNYMNNFLKLVRSRNITSKVDNPKINVCECNANLSNADARPQFFKNLAKWLDTYPGGRRMLTFFPKGGGPHSVEWGPPKQTTIDALNFIQSTYG